MLVVVTVVMIVVVVTVTVVSVQVVVTSMDYTPTRPLQPREATVALKGRTT